MIVEVFVLSVKLLAWCLSQHADKHADNSGQNLCTLFFSLESLSIVMAGIDYALSWRNMCSVPVLPELWMHVTRDG